MSTIIALPTQNGRNVRQNRNNVRLRLTARGRAVIAVLVTLAAVLATALAVFFMSTPAASAGAAEAVTTETVTISEGETLWAVASQYAPAGTDVRDFVLMLQDINDLDSATVQPGQQLDIPVQ